MAAQQSHIIYPIDLLGFIKSVGGLGFAASRPYRYLIAVQKSLEDLFDSPGPMKRKLLCRRESLRLAVTLSSSLLNFGSYESSWFPNRWRSKDIMFFLGQPLDASANTTLNPYISPPIASQTPDAIIEEQCSKSTKRISTGWIRNEHFFSFTLVLIEIAMGGNFSILIRIPARTWRFLEFYKAQSIVESGAEGSEMGAHYERVVR